jgi:DNA polymerase elongation subunit (family B)
MTRQEKEKRLNELRNRANMLKRDVDYYNALQLALKLVLNGSYGAFAAPYFILYNNNVAGTITAEGRELTRKMDEVNEFYWYNLWHLDTELHKKLSVRNVKPITTEQKVSIYGDTDSIFVSFKPAMDSCEWRNQIFPLLERVKKYHLVLGSDDKLKIKSDYCLGLVSSPEQLVHKIEENREKLSFIAVDGIFVKNREFNKLLDSGEINLPIKWNWSCEKDFIQGVDKFKFADYFKECLDKHA